MVNNNNEIKNLIDNRASKFFDAFANTFDTLYEKKRNPLMRIIDHYFRSDIELRFKKTFESFGSLDAKSILDIGCGSGVYLKYALDKDAKMVTGIDPAPNMLKISQERLNDKSYENKYELIEGAFLDLTIEKKYDHVIVMGVMDYIEHPIEFLSGLKKVLNGSAAISFPSKHWFRTPIRNFRYKLRNCPVYFYNEKIITSLLTDSGFSNFEINKIPGAGMDYQVSVYK